MTIPILVTVRAAEHRHGSERDEEDGARSGLCPACSGRFEHHPTGVVSLHDAAEIDEREPWPESS